jgi:spore germination protein GerM
MVKQQRENRIPMNAVAGIAALAIAAGGGAAWWHWHSAPTTTPSSNTKTEVPPPPPSPVQSQVGQKVEIYWLKDTGNKQELVPKPITATADRPGTVLETAFNSLLAGPKDAGVSTTIPEGTKLRSVKMENNGIIVDLSKEFTTGGGSAAMTGRVAQVIYTATSLKPTAQVWIEVEGKPLEILGGEGLELEQPLTRKSFKENFTL